jgi:prepilin-type N-terminal cleavage/methylation domain-containing protein
LIRVKNNSGRNLETNPGFTLVELLLAIFILALVMATILGTFTGILSSARSAEKRTELYQTGRSVMDVITTDIRCMLSQGKEYSEGTHHDNFSGYGAQESGLTSFITTNTLTMGREQSPFLSEVAYRLKRNPQGTLFSLWRRAESPPSPPLNAGGREVPLCRIVESFRLEIQKGSARKKDSVSLLPAAVLVDFTLNLDGDRERFVTKVRPVAAREATSHEKTE